MRRTVFAVGMLLLVPLSAAFAQGGRNGDAMSPVGAWDFEIVDTLGEPPQKSLVVFHFGGTALVTSASGPPLNGTWEKTGGRKFVVSFYGLLADDTGNHIGYIKAMVENVLVDKNTIEGRTEVWILLGTDPFNPLDKFLFAATDDVGTRLRAEGPS